MSQPANDPVALEQIAMTLASGAAEVVRTAAASGVEVSTKTTATDLVTQVDKLAERWLADQLATTRPRDGLLAEEGHGMRSSTGVVWVIDPIDGTVNFVLGLPQYAVSVGVEVDGEVVAGAVCNVANGELFHAHAGGGAHLAEQVLTGPRSVPLSGAVVGTGFGYEAGRRARQAGVVAALLPRVGDIRRLGSAALDLCAVAAGRLDAYFESGLNPWDYAAGALIAREAGCVVTGLRGAPIAAPVTVAAGPALAGEFVALLEELDADRVDG